MKKRRDAGVGFLIKIDATITATDPDICDPRIMAINMTIAGFRVRIINGYSPTNIDGSTSQKEEFYRKLRKACIKQEKHQKIIIAGDFNAQTEIIYGQCFFDGFKRFLALLGALCSVRACRQDGQASWAASPQRRAWPPACTSKQTAGAQIQGRRRQPVERLRRRQFSAGPGLI